MKNYEPFSPFKKKSLSPTAAKRDFDLLLNLFVNANLVANCARCFASRLTGCLAFATTLVFNIGSDIGGVNRYYMFVHLFLQIF